MKNFFVVALAATFLTSATVQPQAAAQKPAVVISLASPQELLNDFNFLASAAGAEQVVALAQFMAQQYLQMMDVNLPAGVTVDLSGGEPVGMGFLPIKDYGRMKEMLTAQVGEPQDQGGGVFKLGLGQPVFMKHQGDYVFVAPKAAMLQGVPADPARMLSGLDKKYALAVRCNVQSIPAQLREVMTTEMKQAFEREMSQKGDDAEAQLAEKVGRNTLSQLTQLIDEADTATIGWGVDQVGGKTYLDFSMTALPNSKLSEKMNLLSRATTAFTGFDFPEAAAKLNFASIMGQDDIQHTTELLTSLETALNKQIDEDNNQRNKQALKDIVDSVFTVLKKTAATGKTDGGGVLLLSETDPKLQMAMGGYVADGAEFNRAFRNAIQLASADPNFPQVNLNAATYRNVDFHTLSISGLDKEGQKVFGGRIDVAVGIGPTAVYVAVGGKPVELLKKVIDKASQPVAAMPMKLTIALTPIVRFAKAVDDAPAADAILEALAKSVGRDHITVSSRVIANGVQYRVNIEDGILRAVAKASGL